MKGALALAEPVAHFVVEAFVGALGAAAGGRRLGRRLRSGCAAE